MMARLSGMSWDMLPTSESKANSKEVKILRKRRSLS
jgi:hypothetical protein